MKIIIPKLTKYCLRQHRFYAQIFESFFLKKQGSNYKLNEKCLMEHRIKDIGCAFSMFQQYYLW
jgi:hypothetical protein